MLHHKHFCLNNWRYHNGRTTKVECSLLPLRGLVVFPTIVMHLDVGRDKSVQALEKAMMNEN